MKINKNKLIDAFEEVQPGIGSPTMIEQANSFGFVEGFIITYNDSISVRAPLAIDLKGSVEASSFYNILKKFKSDKEGNIEIELEEDQIILKAGKRSKAGLTLKTEMKLPLEEIEIEDDWRKIPENFVEGLNVCSFTASNDFDDPKLTCLNIDGYKIQSSDGVRLTQYTLLKKVKMNCLIPASSIIKLIKYPITHYSVSEEWIHFKTPKGTIFSCRTIDDTFPDISGVLEVEGTNLKFHRKTIEALDKAGVFSKSSTTGDIEIHIKDGSMNIKGKGIDGWYKESISMDCEEEIIFEVSPIFLKSILIDLKECIIDSENGKMKFINENWEYVLNIEVKE